jgi:hypothetical protein
MRKGPARTILETLNVVGRGCWIDELLAVRLQRLKGADFVGAHEAAIAGNATVDWPLVATQQPKLHRGSQERRVIPSA